MKTYTFVAACIVGATAAFPVAATAGGQELHDGNCTSCHDSAMYTRADRKMTSLDGLRSQVQRCEASISLQWFDDDINAVADYLNGKYYQFK